MSFKFILLFQYKYFLKLSNLERNNNFNNFALWILEITGTEGISVGTRGSIEDFLGNLEMPADKYKSTIKQMLIAIDTIKGEDGGGSC